MNETIKFLFDECLTKNLVPYARNLGFPVSSRVPWIGMMSEPDHKIKDKCIEDDWTIVTNNNKDFIQLYQNEQLHAGLVCLYYPFGTTMYGQIDYFKRAIDEIENRRVTDLINKLIEVKPDSVIIREIGGYVEN